MRVDELSTGGFAALKPSVLHSLDALNSWVRATAHSKLRSDLQKAIYHAKLEAIQAAYCATDEQVKPVFRRVFERKKCRVCDGSGLWFSYYDHEREQGGMPCRTCRATGIATLRFVETSFPGLNLCWHTPAQRWWSASMNVYCKFEASLESIEGYESVGDDWSSNRPGRELSISEVEQHLETALIDPIISKAFVFILGTFQHRFSPDTLPAFRVWLHRRLQEERNSLPS